MVDFRNVKVGDKLVCINPDGWGEEFVKGGVYEATGEWGKEGQHRLINEVFVSVFHEVDFCTPEQYCKNLAQQAEDVTAQKSFQATDVTVEVDGKPFDGFIVSSEITPQENQEVKERLVSRSGYVTKTTYQSVGDVTPTVTYHFEKYEDFQRYEDSLKEEDV